MITAVGPMMMNTGNVCSIKQNSHNKHENSNVSFKSIPLGGVSIPKVLSQAIICVGGMGTSACSVIFPFVKASGTDLGHALQPGFAKNFVDFCSDANPLVALMCGFVLFGLSSFIGTKKYL